MPRAVADRVAALWTGVGTGSVSGMGAALSGFQAFPSALNGEIVGYSIRHQANTEAEAGFGTWNSGTGTLTRTFRTYPTRGGAAVNFSAGNKEVRITLIDSETPFFSTTDPTGTDDINSGFLEGRSGWLNRTTNTFYLCVDHTAGAAVWASVGTGTAIGVNYDDTLTSFGDNVQVALDFIGTLLGAYVPLEDISTAGAGSPTTFQPASGTRVTFATSGAALDCLLDDTFVNGGEAVLIKGSGSGAINVIPGAGKTLNGAGSTIQLISTATLYRIGNNYTLVGGTSAAKDFDGSVIQNYKPNSMLKSGAFTVPASDNGAIYYCTAAFTITWPNLGNAFQFTVIAAQDNVVINGTGGTDFTVTDETAAYCLQENNTQSVWPSSGRTVVS